MIKHQEQLTDEVPEDVEPQSLESEGASDQCKVVMVGGRRSLAAKVLALQEAGFHVESDLKGGGYEYANLEDIAPINPCRHNSKPKVRPYCSMDRIRKDDRAAQAAANKKAGYGKRITKKDRGLQ